MKLRMHSRVLLALVVVCLVPVVWSRVRRFSKHQNNQLSKARCDLVCLEANKETRGKCRSQCRSQEQKPGTCPIQDTPKWAAACVEACNADSQCDGTQRCCHHGCGSTCSEPLDLQVLPGLPALPTVDKVKEKKRAVVVQWSDGVGDAARAVPGRILYILEEQHHVGPKYEETRLGDWNMLLRTNKTRSSLKNLLKPGRWYRFRVAAVSASGTRGFSEPSAPFTPRKGPRNPPPPKKLRVHPMKAENGTVTVRLEWKEPNSDLPVIRYKVYWSRRVKGLAGPLDSVFVKQQIVPKEQNYVDITDLLPNSMYFLQVQTVSQYGQSKLRSNKASIFYNTTNVHENQRIDAPQQLVQKNDKSKIKGLKLQKIVWYNHKLKANISWEPLPKNNEQPRKYFVYWQTLKCDQPKKDLTAVTEKNTFEIYELNYRCSYKIKVNRSRKSKKPDSELIINVPGCEYFKQKINATSLNCNT
ncbi:anosmin-1 [Ostrinia nubilalis]|uniref:anosmin-1 n=1 Tax=Ostrinia nubilalis TaxID=29057 RepID=UPI0030824DBA